MPMGNHRTAPAGHLPGRSPVTVPPHRCSGDTGTPGEGRAPLALTYRPRGPSQRRAPAGRAPGGGPRLASTAVGGRSGRRWSNPTFIFPGRIVSGVPRGAMGPRTSRKVRYVGLRPVHAVPGAAPWARQGGGLGPNFGIFGSGGRQKPPGPPPRTAPAGHLPGRSPVTGPPHRCSGDTGTPGKGLAPPRPTYRPAGAPQRRAPAGNAPKRGGPRPAVEGPLEGGGERWT
jgi:hypothetical protein